MAALPDGRVIAAWPRRAAARLDGQVVAAANRSLDAARDDRACDVALSGDHATHPDLQAVLGVDAASEVTVDPDPALEAEIALVVRACTHQRAELLLGVLLGLQDPSEPAHEHLLAAVRAAELLDQAVELSWGEVLDDDLAALAASPGLDADAGVQRLGQLVGGGLVGWCRGLGRLPRGLDDGGDLTLLELSIFISKELSLIWSCLSAYLMSLLDSRSVVTSTLGACFVLSAVLVVSY